MRYRPLPFAAALACLAPIQGCGGGSEGPGHGVLLIGIESLRADHLESYGYDRATMPVLDALAEQGALFERVLATSPLRIPSHASLLTGSDPNLARRRVPQWFEASLDQSWSIPRDVPHLAVELAVAGYRTAAFVDHPELSGGFGFDRGFQDYEQLWDVAWDEEQGIERATKRLHQWVREGDRNDDWFAFVHLGDLERIWTEVDALRDTYFEPRRELNSIPPVGSSDPCLFAIPPSRWLGASFTVGQYEARYDGALRRLDVQLTRLLKPILDDPRFENTTVCIVGSYGLQFGEAGLMLDHGRLSAADLHVPWILRPAPGTELNLRQRVDSVASTSDVAPTLLELAGVDVPPAMTGVSQLAAAVDADTVPREVAFASCAIQGGYAAFDRDYALEVIFPAEAHPRLVESWFGYPHEGAASPVELRYRWLDEDYPGFAAQMDRGQEYENLRRAGASWIDRVEDLRNEVQQPTPLFIGDSGEDGP